jgi:hypothetical protein
VSKVEYVCEKCGTVYPADYGPCSLSVGDGRTCGGKMRKRNRP